MTPIRGNTYPHRRALRDLGGKWDARLGAWLVPDEVAEEARAIVSGRRVQMTGELEETHWEGERLVPYTGPRRDGINLVDIPWS